MAVPTTTDEGQGGSRQDQGGPSEIRAVREMAAAEKEDLLGRLQAGGAGSQEYSVVPPQDAMAYGANRQLLLDFTASHKTGSFDPSGRDLSPDTQLSLDQSHPSSHTAVIDKDTWAQALGLEEGPDEDSERAVGGSGGSGSGHTWCVDVEVQTENSGPVDGGSSTSHHLLTAARQEIMQLKEVNERLMRSHATGEVMISMAEAKKAVQEAKHRTQVQAEVAYLKLESNWKRDLKNMEETLREFREQVEQLGKKNHDLRRKLQSTEASHQKLVEKLVLKHKREVEDVRARGQEYRNQVVSLRRELHSTRDQCAHEVRQAKLDAEIDAAAALMEANLFPPAGSKGPPTHVSDQNEEQQQKLLALTEKLQILLDNGGQGHLNERLNGDGQGQLRRQAAVVDVEVQTDAPGAEASLCIQCVGALGVQCVQAEVAVQTDPLDSGSTCCSSCSVNALLGENDDVNGAMEVESQETVGIGACDKESESPHASTAKGSSVRNPNGQVTRPENTEEVAEVARSTCTSSASLAGRSVETSPCDGGYIDDDGTSCSEAQGGGPSALVSPTGGSHHAVDPGEGWNQGGGEGVEHTQQSDLYASVDAIDGVAVDLPPSPDMQDKGTANSGDHTQEGCRIESKLEKEGQQAHVCNHNQPVHSASDLACLSSYGPPSGKWSHRSDRGEVASKNSRGECTPGGSLEMPQGMRDREEETNANREKHKTPAAGPPTKKRGMPQRQQDRISPHSPRPFRLLPTSRPHTTPACPNRGVADQLPEPGESVLRNLGTTDIGHSKFALGGDVSKVPRRPLGKSNDIHPAAERDKLLDQTRSSERGSGLLLDMDWSNRNGGLYSVGNRTNYHISSSKVTAGSMRLTSFDRMDNSGYLGSWAADPLNAVALGPPTSPLSASQRNSSMKQKSDRSLKSTSGSSWVERIQSQLGGSASKIGSIPGWQSANEDDDICCLSSTTTTPHLCSGAPSSSITLADMGNDHSSSGTTGRRVLTSSYKEADSSLSMSHGPHNPSTAQRTPHHGLGAEHTGNTRLPQEPSLPDLQLSTTPIALHRIHHETRAATPTTSLQGPTCRSGAGSSLLPAVVCLSPINPNDPDDLMGALTRSRYLKHISQRQEQEARRYARVVENRCSAGYKSAPSASHQPSGSNVLPGTSPNRQDPKWVGAVWSENTPPSLSADINPLDSQGSLMKSNQSLGASKERGVQWQSGPLTATRTLRNIANERYGL